MFTVLAVLPYLAVAVMVAVVGVLFLGVFTMSKGDAFNARWGNRLMRLRVLLQGVAVGLLAVLAVLTYSYGG